MQRKKRRHDGEDFQMAPMIDMVFLLLVFFMCVSSLAQADKAIEIDLPESAESQVPENLAYRGIVSVKADGTIFLGAREVTRAELAAELGRALRENPQLRVQVRADQETRFAEIQRVLKVCAEAGAVDVIYSTFQSY
jgi:biopolymer transport protein ExbD